MHPRALDFVVGAFLLYLFYMNMICLICKKPIKYPFSVFCDKKCSRLGDRQVLVPQEKMIK